VRLVAMTEAEFQAYLEDDIQRYAQAHVHAGNWEPEEALQRSGQEHERLLPEGLASENQYLFSLEDEKPGSKIGIIWFAVYGEGSHRRAFIYDFLIQAEFRRRGDGREALMALEEKVKELGVDTIALHMFGYNHAARALYEKVGYEVTGLFMSKRLVGPGGG